MGSAGPSSNGSLCLAPASTSKTSSIWPERNCFGRDLVNRHGSATFGGTLEKLARLLLGASSPLFTAPSPEVALRWQAFSRLRTKLGWTAKELDAPVYPLWRLELDSFSGWKCDRGIFSTSPFVVKSIAALAKLGSWLRVHPATFAAPLGRPGLLQGELGRLSDCTQGSTRPTGRSKWPVELFDTLATASGIGDMDITLHVPSFSELYRYQLLRPSLGAQPRDATTSFAMDGGQGVEETSDVFSVPSATDTNTFSCPESAAEAPKPKLEINDVNLPFVSGKQAWSPYTLGARHPHRLTGSLPIDNCSVKTMQVADIQQAIVRVGNICARMGLTADEIESLQARLPAGKEIFSLDFKRAHDEGT
ncbi:hypothetical protein MAPG_10755 [Magnaporthiopsis poae ATCC 64411]|uniref:Uncharacterized protein n=1 Tax=Magnaporthiopsis poae (strain ATCC 64411 / 73-15) TaxID=644358 RepID=A0A0C4EDF7_MAGP6|nr:hypothetical protein MAPG_10755 [Magnaporthiopsis poae ATCC 64411]